MRGQPIVQPNTDLFYFERDASFSSHYDMKVARLLANELLQSYLNGEIHRLQESFSEKQELPSLPFQLAWTRSKTDLVELIYAICESDCFNHGKISVKRLSDYFEKIFNVHLLNVYHTYNEIRGRGNRTQFLDELRVSLLAKMEADDNK